MDQTVLALDGLTKEEKAKIWHREKAEELMLYAEGDSAAAHHLYEGFSHPKKLEIICEAGSLTTFRTLQGC